MTVQTFQYKLQIVMTILTFHCKLQTSYKLYELLTFPGWVVELSANENQFIKDGNDLKISRTLFSPQFMF